MRRKSVRALLKSIGQLRATVAAERALIARRLAARPAAPPAAAGAYPLVLEHLGAELLALETGLATAEDGYAMVKQLPADLRRERDRAATRLHKLHGPLRRLLGNFFEVPGPGSAGRALRGPHRLVAEAAWTLGLLRRLERDPPPPVRGICLDPGAAADELETAHDRLESVLDELDAAEARAAVARADTEAAVAQAESVVPWLTRALEGLAGLSRAGCASRPALRRG